MNKFSTIAIQMDPLEVLDYNSDSTYLIALEAQRRGYKVYVYQPQQLFVEEGKLKAHVHHVTFYKDLMAPFQVNDSHDVLLSDVDIIFLRQDPPFNMAYITSTYLLEMVSNDTLILNNPKGVRNTSEKLSIMMFPELTAPTLVTSQLNDILRFREKYHDIVIKPLYGRGGEGVFHFRETDDNLSSFIDFYKMHSDLPLMVQKFIPDVSSGDKRIIIIDGEPIGAVMRKPKKGDFRANIHAGATFEKTEITKNDQSICQQIRSTLIENGLFFVGIDIIGSFLSEINVTSPTGLHKINQINNMQIESCIWDVIEKKFHNFYQRKNST